MIIAKDAFDSKTYGQKYDINNIQKMTGLQLYKLGNQLETDVHHFQSYREKSVLKLMFLHTKRRHRLLSYFAFNKYKTQVYKHLISDFVQKENLGLSRGLKSFEKTYVEQKSQDKVLDHLFGHIEQD